MSPWDAGGNRHAFLLDSGIVTLIEFPGAESTVARGINNLGDIVGMYSDTAGVWHGFLLNQSGFVSLDFSATQTQAFDINDKRKVLPGLLAGDYAAHIIKTYFEFPPIFAADKNRWNHTHPGAQQFNQLSGWMVVRGDRHTQAGRLGRRLLVRSVLYKLHIPAPN